MFSNDGQETESVLYILETVDSPQNWKPLLKFLSFLSNGFPSPLKKIPFSNEFYQKLSSSLIQTLSLLLGKAEEITLENVSNMLKVFSDLTPKFIGDNKFDLNQTTFTDHSSPFILEQMLISLKAGNQINHLFVGLINSLYSWKSNFIKFCSLTIKNNMELGQLLEINLFFFYEP